MIRKTRSMSGRPRWIAAAAVAVLVAALAAPEVRSQSKPDRKRFAASVFVGVARPADRSFRELYGKVGYPLAAQVDCGIYRHILVYAGYAHFGRTGKTLVEDSMAAPESDSIRFGMHTVKLGLLYTVPLGRVTLLGGGGPGFHFYRETWEVAGVATSGSKAGFTAQGGVEYALTRSFSLVGRIEYSHATVKATSPMESNVELGRFETSLGLSIDLNRLLQR